MSLENAERFLQKMYNTDITGETNAGSITDELQTIGVMDVHYVLYNGGLLNIPEIVDHMKTYPNGAFVSVVRGLMECRKYDYSPETLTKIYKLNEIDEQT